MSFGRKQLWIQTLTHPWCVNLGIKPSKPQFLNKMQIKTTYFIEMVGGRHEATYEGPGTEKVLFKCECLSYLLSIALSKKTWCLRIYSLDGKTDRE